MGYEGEQWRSRDTRGPLAPFLILPVNNTENACLLKAGEPFRTSNA